MKKLTSMINTVIYLYRNHNNANPLANITIIFNERSKTVKFTGWVIWKILTGKIIDIP